MAAVSQCAMVEGAYFSPGGHLPVTALTRSASPPRACRAPANAVGPALLRSGPSGKSREPRSGSLPATGPLPPRTGTSAATPSHSSAASSPATRRPATHRSKPGQPSPAHPRSRAADTALTDYRSPPETPPGRPPETADPEMDFHVRSGAATVVNPIFNRTLSSIGAASSSVNETLA